jgi:hypothetical protein
MKITLAKHLINAFDFRKWSCIARQHDLILTKDTRGNFRCTDLKNEIVISEAPTAQEAVLTAIHIGDDVVRVFSVQNGHIFPEVRGKITHVYADGVRIVACGLPFFLSNDSFGQDWIHCFDFHHLVCAITSVYCDRQHVRHLAESWGERLVLAAAQKVSPLVFMKVLDICLSK